MGKKQVHVNQSCLDVTNWEEQHSRRYILLRFTINFVYNDYLLDELRNWPYQYMFFLTYNRRHWLVGHLFHQF